MTICLCTLAVPFLPLFISPSLQALCLAKSFKRLSSSLYGNPNWFTGFSALHCLCFVLLEIMPLPENKTSFIWSIKRLYSSTSRRFKSLNNINISCLRCTRLPTDWNNESKGSARLKHIAHASPGAKTMLPPRSASAVHLCVWLHFLLWKYLHCCPILLSFNTKEKLFQLWRWFCGPVSSVAPGLCGGRWDVLSKPAW